MTTPCNPPKPAIVPVDDLAVPDILKRYDRWVIWSWTWNGKKWDKPPRDARTGNPAATNDPSTWSSYRDAKRAQEEGAADGIGFVFGAAEDGLILSGVDLDDCRDPETGKLTEQAQYIVGLIDSYTEISPSGNGVKIFTSGALPPGRRADHTRGIEMYEGGRYFTVTGQHLGGTPTEILDRTEQLRRLHEMVFGRSDAMRGAAGGTPEVALAVDALQALDPSRASDYSDWVAVGMALHSVDVGLLDEWDRWSQHCPTKYQPGECQRRWGSFDATREIGIGTLVYMATQDGWVPPWKRRGSAQTAACGSQATGPYRVISISSAELLDRQTEPVWLVERLLILGQTAMFGGPKKSLKTSLLVDLAISLGASRATTQPVDYRFLGHFHVPQQRRVLIVSGESGDWTLRETAIRVARAKNASLCDVAVRWAFELPRLSRQEHLDALADHIREHGSELVILDPMYLALLAGNPYAKASNMFDMGPLLANLSRTCLDAGATPILCHHTHGRYRVGEMPELGDLAYSGFQEFGRQWVLVGRREPYVPGTGEHRLWLVAGGSAGHGGEWAVDVHEGTLNEQFGGRDWRVRVANVSDARSSDREARRQNKESEYRERIAQAARHFPEGETKRVIRDTTGMSNESFRPVFGGMLAEGLFLEVEIVKNKRREKGYRLAHPY